MDVQVLDYDVETNKFTVKVMHNDQVKKIGKLSLLFNFENAL